MRAISPTLQTFLGAGTRCTMRHLVTITLSSGTVVRWTDHTADITIGGNTWTAGGSGTAPLLQLGRRRDPAGTEIGELDLTLYCGETAQLDGVRLPLAVINDALDGAKVKVERVYGPDAIDLSLGTMDLFDGVVAESDPSSTVVKLALVDARETLNITLPRIEINPPCSAMLFDGQCSLSKATWTRTGTVAAGSTATLINTNRTETDGWFTLGVITFTSGANNGVKRAVRAYKNASGQFELAEALPAAPAVGDTFSAYPGCDKRYTTCGSKFFNTVHFRGFPLLPTDPTEDRKGNAMPWLLGHDASGYTGIAPNVSPPSNPLPIVYGRAKITGTVVYRLRNTTSPYGVAAVVAFCEGPVVDGRRFWIGSNYYGSIHALDQSVTVVGVTGPATVFKPGTRPTQDGWFWLPVVDPTYSGVQYPGVAVWCAHSRNIPVGGSESYDLEVDGFLSHAADAGADGDAHPASIIADPTYGLLTNGQFGAGFAWPVVTDLGPDGTAASSARRYITAAGLLLSPVISQKRKVLDVLQELLDSTNCSCRMSDGSLEIIPLGDVAFSTYAPDLTVQYGFTADNFIVSGDEDTVAVKRPSRAEVFNIIPVEFNERDSQATDPSKAYATRSVEDPEPVDVAQNGERRSAAVSLPMITKPEVALTISRLRAQKSLRRRNSYTFKVGFQFAPLEPLDYVTLTDTRFGLADRVVRIQAIEEDTDGVLTIEAEDAPLGMSHAVAHTVQTSDSSFIGNPWLDQTRTLGAALASTWYSITMPAGSYNAVTYAPELRRWCAVGDGVCATSDDGGRTWASRTIQAGVHRAICWTGAFYVTAGNNGLSSKSTDGVTWTAQGLPNVTSPAGTVTTYHAIAFDGTNIVAVADKTRLGVPAPLIQRSTTGTSGSWSEATTYPSGETFPTALTASNGRLIMGGSRISVSDDHGATWTTKATIYQVDAFASPSPGTLVAIYDDGTSSASVFSPDNGDTWSSGTPMDALYVTLAAVANGALVAAGWNGTGYYLSTSTDNGQTWQRRFTYGSADTKAMASDGSRVVAVGWANFGAYSLAS